jgi:hypothetical protein
LHPLVQEPVKCTSTIVVMSFALLGCPGAVFPQEPAAAIRAAVASLVSDPDPALGVYGGRIPYPTPVTDPLGTHLGE